MDTKRCGLYVLLFAVSFIGLSGLLSDNASAASIYDNHVHITDTINQLTDEGLVDRSYNWSEVVRSILLERQEYDILNKFDDNVNIGSGWLVYGMNPNTGNDPQRSFSVLIFEPSAEITFKQEALGNSYYSAINFSHGDIHVIQPRGGNYINDDNQVSYVNIGTFTYDEISPYYTGFYNQTASEGNRIHQQFFMLASDNVVYPSNYEGEIIPDSPDIPTYSNWTPDIKLHQGSDWKVELSDYNFFTFDKVAFTCGEHELAPVINWEVWDITDDPNRVLIDTLIFGAPALVTYNAPKIQEDKRYEIVAYYSDCEGYNFTEASTKQFTVKKDGTLNPPDYMVVCIREDFPYVNVQDCWAEVNDFLTILTFRTPTVGDVGGGVFSNIVDGCRELQVIDTWIFATNQEVCPQIPNNIRSIVTPFVTFALGLMAASFIAHSKSVRSLN